MQIEDNSIFTSAIKLSQHIKNKDISAREALEQIFINIDRYEEKHNCYITIDKEYSMNMADRVQERINKKDGDLPLAGVPIAIKDNICTKNLKTTCASAILNNYVPPYNATVVDRIIDAGAVIVGKTNMDEFGMGNTTSHSIDGSTKNPYDEEKSSGGSSGGSCAAVALGECLVALGTDTGGSIRQPASHCGVVGIKPTYGTVSRYGMLAYASSFEQIGPIASNVEDVARVLETIAGYDSLDNTSRYNICNNYTSTIKNSIKGMRIGIPYEYFEKNIEKDVLDSVLEAANVLKSQGAIIEWFNLDLTKYIVPTYYIIACSQASSNLARYDGVKYGMQKAVDESLEDMYIKTRTDGFSSEVKKRIMLGTYTLSSGYYEQYYLKALKMRNLIKKTYEKALERYDMIFGPICPNTAPLLKNKMCDNKLSGEYIFNNIIKLENSNIDSLNEYLQDIYTAGANITGLPAIAVPCNVKKNSMPIGFQLIGGYFKEQDIIKMAYNYEKVVRRCV